MGSDSIETMAPLKQRIAMPLKATSVRLDDETSTRVGQMGEVIKQNVAREEWLALEVERGLKAAEEGRLINHADIKTKWEAKRAAHVTNIVRP